MNYIVIPEGLAGDGRGRPLAAPSFVYRQVLDHVLSLYAEGDAVYLAPANTYDGQTEHELAFRYLKAKNSGCHVLVPEVVYEKYVDTRDNARLLKAFLGEAYREMPFVLICAALHSYRTAYCFKNEGFRIAGIQRVAYTITGEAIARRWWYYRYRSLHILYEGLAFCRDLMIGTFSRRPHAEAK